MSVSNPPSAEVALTGTRLGDYLREKIFRTSIFATPGSELHDVTRLQVFLDAILAIILITPQIDKWMKLRLPHLILSFSLKHLCIRFAVKTNKFINFFIDTGYGNIGVWFMEPEDIQQPKNSVEKTKAVLYVHGVKGNRASPGRMCVYNILLSLGYKVFSVKSDCGCIFF